MQPATRESSHELRTVSPEDLLRDLAGGRRVLVVDVREASEIARSGRRLPGAIDVPVHQIFLRRGELPSASAVDRVVAVSRQGVRARAAAFALSLLGYVDVRVLDGGVDAWAARGFPFV